MAIVVPPIPPDFRLGTGGTTTGTIIRAAHPVRSATWTAMADAVNYLHGHGGTLMSHPPYMTETGIAAGSSMAAYTYEWPRYENPHRLWCVTIEAVTASKSAFGTISNGTESADWVLNSAGFGSVPTLVVATLQETVTASATPANVSLTIANNAASATSIRVVSVGLHELPRTALDAGYGVQYGVLAPRNPIVGTTSGDLSIESVHRHQRTAKTVARKNMLFNWSYPDGVSETGTSFVDLWDFEPELRCRFLEQANTTRSVAWTAFTVCSSGASGEIKLTASQSGQTDTMSFNNTTGAWQTPRTLTINTEDPSRWTTDSGLRGGTAESVQAAIRRVSGGTDVTVLAIAIGEST